MPNQKMRGKVEGKNEIFPSIDEKDEEGDEKDEEGAEIDEFCKLLSSLAILKNLIMRLMKLLFHSLFQVLS